MRTEIQSSKIQPVDLNPNEDLLKSLLKLDRDQFNQVIKSYKLQYDKDNASLNELTSFQSYFNRKFEITDNPRDDDKDFRKFLNEKINKAFQNPEKIQEYFEAIDRVQDPKSEGRGIHGGNHVARVALYSKMLLNLYRKYKDHLPENLQKEIEEFDEQKEKDLEVLTLMHDCARTHGKHDQFEYKNAFYVALMMRRLGDPRFTGDSISDEGLDLITNLSLKESEEKDKSLMSKLIQSADSLAITRDSKIIFDHNYVNATHDFYQIENSEMKARALNEMNQLAHLISYHEFVNKHKKTKDETEILEFVGNPFEVFCKKITEEQFLQKFEQAREDSSLIIPQEFDRISHQSYFVHVHNSQRYLGPVVDKLNQEKFLNATLIIAPIAEFKDAFINHYADIGWYSNFFIIFNQNQDNGVIFLTGFQRDIGSDHIRNLAYQAPNDFVLIKEFPVKAWQRPHQDRRLIFSAGKNTLPEFIEKIPEIMSRRIDPESDISDQEYFVKFPHQRLLFEVSRIGKGRYGPSFSVYKGIKIPNPQLMHNECHVYVAIHNVLHVGMTRGFLQTERIDNSNDFFGAQRIKTLRQAVVASEQINEEKKRLLDLEEPMEDEAFRFCVNHEFKRIKTCFEKIIYLKKLREEIHNSDEKGSDLPFREVSTQRKISKQQESQEKMYVDNPENRARWNRLHIDKIGSELVILYKELKSYESEESFGIKGLKDFVESLNFENKTDSQDKINGWIDEIMEGKTQHQAVEKVVSKIQSELQHEVKIVAQDLRDPANLIVIDKDYLDTDKEVARIKAEVEKYQDDIGDMDDKEKKSQDLSRFSSFLQNESGYVLLYKYFKDKKKRDELFSKKIENEAISSTNLDNFVLENIIKKHDVNSLKELLENNFLDLNECKKLPLIHVIESCSNIDKIKDLVEIFKSNGLESKINEKDEKGLTVLDKMLPKCTAKFLQELLDLGFEVSSKEAIEAVLKSKKESVKKVIFENDKLRDGLTIESLKIDENYKSFFDKLASGNAEILEQVIKIFDDYAINKNSSYDLEFNGKKIKLSANKIIEFLEQNKEVDDVPCASFRSRRVGSETNELKINLNQLSEEQKSRLLDSLRNAKGSPETSVLSNANAQATLVFAPSSQNSMS